MARTRKVFKDVTCFITNLFSKQEHERLTILLEQYGGTVVTSIEEFKRNGVTHVITPSIEFIGYVDVKVAGLKVVTGRWVDRCVLGNELLTELNYFPDPKYFFSGMLVYVDESMDRQDRCMLWAAVEAFGGAYTTKLHDAVTHFCTLYRENPQLEEVEAMRDEQKQAVNDYLRLDCLEGQKRYDNLNSHLVRSVVPHYFEDCVKLRARLDESEYEFPAVSLLWLTAQNDEAVLNDFEKDAVVPEPPKNFEHIGLMRPPVVENKFFMSKFSFYFDPELDSYGGISQETVDSYKEMLKKAGGQLKKMLDASIDYAITNSQKSETYKQALDISVHVASLYWILEVCYKQELISPTDHLLTYPWPACKAPGMDKLKICVSNYAGKSREILKLMIIFLGAEYTSELTPNNTHLICSTKTGAKYESGKEWCLNIVNHKWLEDCWLNWRCVAVTNPEYLIHRQALIRTVGAIPLTKEAIRRQRDTFESITVAEEKTKTPLESAGLKRKRSSINPVENDDPNHLGVSQLNKPRVPKIMFTGCRPRPEQELFLRKLDYIANDMQECTHLVSTKVSRTEKFLVGMAKCDYIVNTEWVEECFRARCVANEDEYPIQDAEYKEKYDRDFRRAFREAKKRQLFKGCDFICTTNAKPSSSIIKNIVEAHGGRLLSVRDDFGEKVIVLSTEGDEDEWEIFTDRGIPVFDSEFLISSVLSQKLQFVEEFLLHK